MDLYGIPLRTLEGEATSLGEHRGKALLIVNVASKCGFTPQYEGLRRLHETYGERGFVVLGFPCNQFLGQEPGSPEEIRDFCSETYGITFPLYEKCDVNGDARHPLFAELTRLPDQDGEAGDVKWNFEKFLVSAAGEPAVRWRTQITPKDPALIGAVEAALPA